MMIDREGELEFEKYEDCEEEHRRMLAHGGGYITS
jgi:hypothetical protein